MKTTILKSLLTLALICVFPLSASAQETSGSFAGGSINIGDDNRACSGALEGAVRYTAATNIIEFCDGTTWSPTGATACTDDDTTECLLNATRSSSDPEFIASNISSGVNILGITGTATGGSTSTPCTIGDAVGDGICAGEWQGYDLIAAPAGCNSGDTVAANCDGTDDTATWGFNSWGDTDSSFTDMVQANADYFTECAGGCTGKAADACAGLALDGETWYLPTIAQLATMYSNRNTGSWTGGGFENDDYWSINIPDSNNAQTINFTDGEHRLQNSDFTSERFRCVRLQARSASCQSDASCTNVGDTCTDGSIFAGFMTYGNSCEAVYMTDTDQSTSEAHSSVNQNNTSDSFDGKANQAWIVANRTLSQYPAFQTCENLSRHSQTDWYLPSYKELSVMAVDYLNVGIGSNRYNTSTQWNSSSAINLNISASTTVNIWGKSSTMYTRCIRRD